MAYIEMHQSLREHKKIFAVADELSMPETHVVGHCVYLWLWSIDNAPDGQLPNSEGSIERGAGWQGERGQLVRAMLNAGFIEQDEGGQYWIHDWYDYAGKLMDFQKETTSYKRDIRRAYKDGTIEKVRKRDGDSCRYCGRAVDWTDRRTEKGGTYDQIDPRENVTVDNIVVSCRGCQTRKNYRSLDDARMKLVPLPKTSIGTSIPALNEETKTSNAAFNAGARISNAASNEHLIRESNIRSDQDLDDDDARARAGDSDQENISTEQQQVSGPGVDTAEGVQPHLLHTQSLHDTIENRLRERMGNTNYHLSGKDKRDIHGLIEYGVSLETIVSGIDLCFARYKPKHDEDQGIRSFGYCVNAIQELNNVNSAPGQTLHLRAGPPQQQPVKVSAGARDERYANFYNLFPD